MAVYTQVSDDALAAFLDEYNLGKALSFKGIAEGVENSNYYLETTTGRFILTLFEKRVNADDLPYFIGLKQHLAGKGFPCPEPILAKDGKALRTLEGRPAVIVSFLDGLSPKKPTPAQCRGLGEGLARMHVTLSDFEMTRPNSLGPSAWPRLWAGQSDEAEKLQPGLSALIDEALADIAEAKPQSLTLPRGTLHDNPGRGAIDYNYFKGANLIAGYESVRPLQPTERDALPLLARGAALRFFLTRMVDWTSTPEGALVKPKNPLEYAGRLAFHRKVTSAEGYGA